MAIQAAFLAMKVHCWITTSRGPAVHPLPRARGQHFGKGAVYADMFP
jgi:hypothetical protein